MYGLTSHSTHNRSFRRQSDDRLSHVADRLGSADERQSTLTDTLCIESGSRVVANEVVVQLV